LFSTPENQSFINRILLFNHLTLFYMKNLFFVSIFLFFASFSSTCFSQILTFEFAGLDGNEPSAVSNFNDLNLTSSTISRGSGITSTNNGDRFNSTGFSTGSLDINDYVGFDVSPNNGCSFSITSIVMLHQRSGTGPKSFELRSSVDNFTNALGSIATIPDVTTTQTTTFTFSLIDIASSTTFRIYAYNAEGAGGTWGPGDGTGNDIVVNGSTSCTPACTSPTTPPSAFSSSNLATTSMDIAWTNGNGDNTLMVARAGSAVNADPMSGSTYTADGAFGSGSQIGTGNYVVYNGSGSMVSITNLISSTTYHYAIYTYNSVDNCYNLTELTGNAMTTGPEIQLEFPVNTDVACGFTIPFGVVSNGAMSDLDFVISNDGTSDLTLTLPLVLGGTNSDQYSIITQPTSPIIPGASSTVTVRFAPTSSGLKTANISIGNDDSNENPCLVNLSGTGAITCPNVGDLIISEIMYNPSAGTESSAEYIEVCNNSASAIDMNGMSINEGGTLRNITSTLIVPAGGCVTIGQLGTCSGSPDFAINLGLLNTGEALSILCNATEIDAVPDYVNTGWPASSDGISIQLNPNNLNATDNDSGSNWCLSTASCGGADTGTPGTTNTSCCSITSPIATAACDGNNADVTITFTATGTSGSLEANVDGQGWMTIMSGGLYTIMGPTVSENGASVSVRDVNENTCIANTTVNIPSCPVVCTGGTLNFQMINPCGDDGQNEFISFTVGGVAVEIADLAFGVTNDGADTEFNYFWGGANTSPADYGCLGITSVASAQSFDFLDPITDAATIAPLIAELNAAAGCTVFIAASAVLDPGANVVVFLGAGTQGFDNVSTNLNFSNNCTATYYAVFGNATGSGGYFSNSQPRLSTLDFGEGCACATQFDYIPSGGEAGYVFNSGPYLSDQPCIPSSVIMPVEMLSFEVIKKETHSVLYFSTASETNNDYFTIERSADGRNYNAIGEMKGGGNSNTTIAYEFTDEKPFVGINYYRIKQTDFDGKYSYSDIKSVRHTSLGNLSITPRTTEGRLQVTTDMEDYTIDVYNVAGQQVKSLTALSYDQLISIDDLMAGLYYVKVNFGNQVETIKVVKI
jgi:Lamin Tail Domain